MAPSRSLFVRLSRTVALDEAPADLLGALRAELVERQLVLDPGVVLASCETLSMPNERAEPPHAPGPGYRHLAVVTSLWLGWVTDAVRPSIATAVLLSEVSVRRFRSPLVIDEGIEVNGPFEGVGAPSATVFLPVAGPDGEAFISHVLRAAERARG